MALWNARCRTLRGYINSRLENGTAAMAGPWSVSTAHSYELAPSVLPEESSHSSEETGCKAHRAGTAKGSKSVSPEPCSRQAKEPSAKGEACRTSTSRLPSEPRFNTPTQAPFAQSNQIEASSPTNARFARTPAHGRRWNKVINQIIAHCFGLGLPSFRLEMLGALI